jgi:hypothetical protein
MRVYDPEGGSGAEAVVDGRRLPVVDIDGGGAAHEQLDLANRAAPPQGRLRPRAVEPFP